MQSQGQFCVEINIYLDFLSLGGVSMGKGANKPPDLGGKSV